MELERTSAKAAVEIYKHVSLRGKAYKALMQSDAEHFPTAGSLAVADKSSSYHTFQDGRAELISGRARLSVSTI